MSNFSDMDNVFIMDHPLIQHKIGIIRKKDTSSKEFREMISEIAMLMCYEATRELPLTDVEIETPICKTTVKELEGKKMAVVPILRAGLGMVDENHERDDEQNGEQRGDDRDDLYLESTEHEGALQEGYLGIRSCKAAGYVGREVLQQV